ncbi:formin-like protein 3 [Papaver somniferum]|uniref:formin-like protein 3 n=1 Tax=Papaver somniferum TaxID=3469 RepID=UPI000E6FAD2A|nr:formin-like protein 3 [Papaver somniferum]
MEPRKVLILVVLGLFGNISFTASQLFPPQIPSFNPELSPPPPDNFAPSQLSPPGFQILAPPPPPPLTPPPPPPPPPAPFPPPPPFVPPPPPQDQSPPPPPPAPQHSPPPPQHWRRPPPPWRNPNYAGRRNEWRKSGKEMNFGKKIGYLFLCVGGALQIGVISFLGFKRWKISKIRDRG